MGGVVVVVVVVVMVVVVVEWNLYLATCFFLVVAWFKFMSK